MNFSHETFLDVLAALKGADAVAAEQRHHPRVGLRALVTIAPFPEGRVVDERSLDPHGNNAEPGPAFAVRMHDMSSGGVALQHHHALPKGKPFVLDLPVRGQAGKTETTRILCRVMHSRVTAEHQFLIGAEFVRIWTSPAPSLDIVRAAA
jgi:hypothetical protein